MSERPISNRWIGGIVLAACLPPAASPREVALAVSYSRAPSKVAVHAARLELAALFAETSITIIWREAEFRQYPQADAHLVFVQLEGACRALLLPPPRQVRGALASVTRVDDWVQPFIDVNCEALAACIRPAMTGAQVAKADAVFGRALGRVLAHELYHYLTSTAHHHASDLMGPSISAATLVAGEVRLDAVEIECLRQSLEVAGPQRFPQITPTRPRPGCSAYGSRPVIRRRSGAWAIRRPSANSRRPAPRPKRLPS